MKHSMTNNASGILPMDSLKTEEPLLAPLTDQEWPASITHLRAGFAGALNIYRLMAHHPPLLTAWETFRNHVVLQSALSPVEREIAILRVGFQWGSSYEWAQHVVRGRQAGLSDAQIESAKSAPDQWRCGDRYESIMRAVDTLLDAGMLPPVHVAELETHLSRAAVFDLLATVGMYTMLAFFAKTYRTPIEPAIAAALS